MVKITNKINPNIFREYDIRGIADEDLTDDVVYTIGRSYGSYVLKDDNHKVVVGYDNRLSSERINSILIKGLTDSGVNVIDLGLVTTPMLYYAKYYYNIYTGIMITASHNPKEYNGFKMSFSKIGNAYGQLIKDFEDYTYKGEFVSGSGEVVKADIKEEYLKNFKKCVDLGERRIKVVFDCGNGTGSVIVKDILDMFNVEYDLLYCESDGTFPNHISDPSVSEYMVDLGKRVAELGYDLGIGIDGDADRVGVVLENGEYVTADLLLLMIYRYLYPNMHNKKALFDVKCSRALIDGLKDLNLQPVMNRTGNSYCNLEMQRGDFDFGGEYSGHFFFRDKYPGFDDGIYAGLRIIEILSNTDKTISQLLSNVNKYYSTEEIKVKVTDESKFKIVDAIKNYAKERGYECNDIDGVRVEFLDSWALVRASNTGPNLTVRFEANSEQRLEEIQKEFMDQINSLISSLI